MINMKKINKLDEAKLIGQYLLEIAKETQETIIAATEERDEFAIGFLQYVDKMYTKIDGQYYFKIEGFTHAHRNIDEVMDSYKHFLNDIIPNV